jgi:hypothetical protein
MDRRVSTEDRRKGTGPTARRLPSTGAGSGSVGIRAGSGAARVSIQASDGWIVERWFWEGRRGEGRGGS